MSHLCQIELKGHKRSEVQAFVDQVRYVLSNLHADDLKDKELMCTWLLAKFEGLAQIAPEIKQIRRAKNLQNELGDSSGPP